MALMAVGATAMPYNAAALAELPVHERTLEESAALYNELSDDFRRCIRRSGGVTANMQDCMAAEYARLDRQLNVAYTRAMGELTTNQARKDLRGLQRGWLRERWSSCRVDMERAGGGSAGDLIYGDCQLREIARRILWLGANPRR